VAPTANDGEYSRVTLKLWLVPNKKNIRGKKAGIIF